MRRSMLFLPGNAPNMLINGACLGADAVILDLEDAVAPSEKDAARTLVRNTMRYMDFKGCEVIVRINSIDTPFWQADLDEILPQKPNLILLPKTGQAQDALEADAYMSQVEDRLGFARNTVGLMPLIETALGVENAFSIASASPRVAALFLGAEDLTADLRCKRTKKGREIEYVVHASSSLPRPISRAAAMVCSARATMGASIILPYRATAPLPWALAQRMASITL